MPQGQGTYGSKRGRPRKNQPFSTPIQSRMPSSSNKGQPGKKSRLPRLTGAIKRAKSKIKKTTTSLKNRREKRISENKWVAGENLTEEGRERGRTRRRARGPISKYKKVTTDMGSKMKKASKSKTTKSVKTKGGEYKVYEKGSKEAKSFRSTFKSKCAGGAKSFTWDGRKYSCDKK